MSAPTPVVPDITRRDWTVEELHALRDDGMRYEVIDGELFVTPAPPDAAGPRGRRATAHPSRSLRCPLHDPIRLPSTRVLEGTTASTFARGRLRPLTGEPTMREVAADTAHTVRYSLPSRIGIVLATIVMGTLLFVMLGLATYAAVGGLVAIAAIILLSAGVIWVLFRYVLRDARGTLGWRVTIRSDGIDLDLPRGRSITHRLASVQTQLRYDEIDAVELRLEAYASFGMVNMHRCDALRLKDGSLILLGEDRGRNTVFATSLLADAVDRIVRAGQLPARDCGMVEGDGGFLGIAGVTAPPWDAPTVAADRRDALWLAAGMTGRLAEWMAFVPLANRR